jgi:hypothetical protein
MARFLEPDAENVMKSPEAAQPQDSQSSKIDSLFIARDPDETRHRRRALVRHVTRWTRQLFASGVAIVIVLFSFPTRRVIANHFANQSISTTFVSSWLAHIELVAWAILPYVMPTIILLLIPLLLWYLREQRRYWRLQIANAHSREPDVCALGYMGVFRVYTRTNRVAIFIGLFGLTAATSAIVGIFFGLSHISHIPTIYRAFLIIGLPILELLLSLALLKIGFEIGRSFVPGIAITKSTIVLALLAATSQTDYLEVQQHADVVAGKIRDDRPWWFYVFGKKLKRGHKLEGGWTDHA